MRHNSALAPLFAAAFAALPAWADPCDTLVIPPGVGIGGPADVTGLNFLVTGNNYNIAASSFLFANLLWIDQQDQIDFTRSIATKIEVLDHGARYRVTLRPWNWSDGAPVTADDVLFTWQLIQKLGQNYGSYGQGGVPNLVTRVTVLNPAQFEVTLSQTVNSNWFELNGLVQLIPLPRHAWGNLTADQLWEDQSQPQFFGVVDGPFKLYDFAMGRSISFVPNPSYPLQRSPFQRLVIKFVQSSGAEIQGIASGELDEANLPHEAFDAGALVPNSHLVTLPPNATYDFIGFNFNNPAVPFFKDPLVRQAIQDSVDQKTMIAKLWHGQGVEVYGPVPAQPPTYLSPAARAGHYPIGFDLKRAAALLDQAGYKPGPDGIRAKNGIRLEFTVIVLSGTATSLMMAQMIQPYLRQTGIAMHIEMMDYGQLLATVEQKIAPWQAYILEADLTAYPSGETNFSTGAFQNFGGYSDPKMDRLITDSTTQPGLDALYQYQDYTSEQVPVIFLPNPRPIELERNGISGIDRVISPGNQYNPQLIIFNREACHAAHVIHAR